jgi:hypothetical protein
MNVDLVNMSSLENQLENMLRPVKPDPAFIRSLQGRLVSTPPTILEPRSGAQAYALVGLGLFGGVLFFWILRQIFKNRD